MAIKKKTIIREEKLLNWNVLILIGFTFLAYVATMGYDFVNWDDIVYIMNNDMITSLSWINLKKIFSSYFMGNYHPFILLSFLFDFQLFKFSAHGYHVHNLLLHLVNSFLVYAFFFHLLKKNVKTAITIAMIFAIHPMHVESVAWISERKDLLYTAYYFLSLLAYLFYIQRGRKLYFYLSLLLFVFSNFSKAQAVTLPVVLILIDYFTNRKFDWKTVLEKVPFFILSLVFGIVAIFAQKEMNYINPIGLSAFQSLFYAPYSLWVYLFKFLIPVNQLSLYEYPLTPDGNLPFYIYFSPVIFLLFIWVIWKTWKSNSYVTFGLLFFLATIFPVLQFLPVGGAIVSERYTYIPYIGLSIIVSMAFWEYRTKLILKNRRMMDYAGIFILALMVLLTWNRTKVWKDSISLWTDLIEKNPACLQAYSNRASFHNEMKDFDKAISDLNEAIKLDVNDSKKLNLYFSRAMMYKKTGKFDSAIIDYSKNIEIYPASYKSYLDRGILYTDQFGKYTEGINDFKSYLKLQPNDLNATFNLGVAFYKNHDPDSARVYFVKVVNLDPANGKAYNLLMTICYQLKDYTAAYKYATLAGQCGIKVDVAMLTAIKGALGMKALNKQ